MKLRDSLAENKSIRLQAEAEIYPPASGSRDMAGRSENRR